MLRECFKNVFAIKYTISKPCCLTRKYFVLQLEIRKFHVLIENLLFKVFIKKNFINAN